MLDPVILFIMGTLALIGSIIGIIASTAAKSKLRTVVLDVGSGALATLAIGVPAMSYAVAEGIDLAGHVSQFGSPGPWLLPLAAYLCGALAAMAIKRLIWTAR